MCKSTRTRLSLTALERRDAPTALGGAFANDEEFQISRLKRPEKMVSDSALVSGLLADGTDINPDPSTPITASQVDVKSVIQVVYDPLQAEAESMTEKANHF